MRNNISSLNKLFFAVNNRPSLYTVKTSNRVTRVVAVSRILSHRPIYNTQGNLLH